MSQYEVQPVNKFDPEIDKWDSQKLTEHLRKGKLNPALPSPRLRLHKRTHRDTRKKKKT